MSKIALITGASSGFGLETARLLSENGYDLILVARRKDKLDDLAKTLDCNCHTYALDVCDKASIKQFFKSIPKEFLKVDLLINNAGLAKGLNKTPDTNLEDWDLMIDTNITGLVHITKLALDLMIKAGNGHIVNIGSVAGHVPYTGGNVYGATKAFVRQFSNNLRCDLIGTGVRVTCIEPGMAETEFSKVRFDGDSIKAKEVYNGMNPLMASDIAETILWVITRPLHVNIDNIEIMPTDQTYGGLSVYRRG